jgi:hypothetical protein
MSLGKKTVLEAQGGSERGPQRTRGYYLVTSVCTVKAPKRRRSF